MEAAIVTRLERLVQEVVEVRQRAQSLAEELASTRTENRVLQVALEEERAALAATRVALESERAQRAALVRESVPTPVEPASAVESLPTEVAPAETTPPSEVTTNEPQAVRSPKIPTPKGILSKLKFGGRKPTVVAEPAPVVEPTPIPEPIEEPAPLATEPEPAISTPKPKKARVKAPVRFAPREFLSGLPRLTDEQLDLAAFGIVQLADDGRCLAINSHAVALLQTTREAAFDAPFFESLLPDSKAAAHFFEGVEKQKLDLVLQAQEQTLQLYRHARTCTTWALLRAAGEES